ncbi:MAG: formylglycine-generating enzyme family protein [Richelia sp. CSU_2_1]|nr:formylglycine-generating enzyme family protein [Microcoleus sp. SU_5_6]NJR26631.1 formylglycine-generating enzyme family protein [Richelia sp. CSU_2_1]
MVTAELQQKKVVINREQRQAWGYAERLSETVELEMVAIPEGQFQMGAPEGEAESFDDEKPQHQVTVKPFFLGKYPITQAQWQAVAKLPKIYYDLESNPSRFKGENRPVERVSWFHAVEFCARLSQKTGNSYRLPSEAEWEYACRAGTTTPFHFGETITTDLANYNGNSTYAAGPEGIYRSETTPVGSFGVANAFGLYDMHGNVWEWCADPWHDSYQGAPGDGTVWDENCNDNRYHSRIDLLVNLRKDNRTRLLRGGSGHNYPRFCRSAIRVIDAPVNRGSNYGFRVACASART